MTLFNADTEQVSDHRSQGFSTPKARNKQLCAEQWHPGAGHRATFCMTAVEVNHLQCFNLKHVINNESQGQATPAEFTSSSLNFVTAEANS